MGIPERKSDEHYTYKNYRSWPDDERWELIDGVAYAMSSPSTAHQSILRELSGQLYNHLKGKPCQFFTAPLDIFFPRLKAQHEDDVDTIVQPDLLVVCDKDKIHDNGIWGAPDFVVEILSPSTSRKDLNEKFRLYEREGVKEYWVIDPVGRWLQQYVPGDDGLYGPQNLLVRTGTVVSGVFPEWSVDIASLWAEI